jgi:hypothetical protein
MVGLLPCNEEEVRILEKAIQLTLPEAYKEYLLTMGKYSGRMNAGTDCFYDNIFDLKGPAKDLLVLNKVDFELPPDAFVFSMHQGYEFDFFRTSEGDNPAVFSFSEGNLDKGVFKSADSFSEFLSLVVAAYGIE